MNLMGPAGVVEDELLPELVDNSGTTRGTMLSVLQDCLPVFGQSWLLTADPLRKSTVIFAKLAWRQDSRRVLE